MAFFSFKDIQNILLRFVALAFCFNFVISSQLKAAVTPVRIPPGTTLVGNPLRVVEYIDSVPVHPCSDLAHVIRQFPINGKEFVDALNEIHPAPLQDLSISTDQNMQSFKQTVVGRNAYLRQGRCIKFDGLYNHCNMGPASMWFTPIGVFNDQAHIGELRGYRSSTAGIMLGVDSQPNKNTILGFGMGYTFTDLHWKKGHGNADWQSGYFGCYGVKYNDYMFVDAAVLGSYSFYKTKRKIDFSKFSERYDDIDRRHRAHQHCCHEHHCHLDHHDHDDDIDCPHCCHDRDHHRCDIDRNPRNRFRGYAILSHLGAGLRYNYCGFNIVPFANLDYDFVDQDGHREYHGISINNRIKANHAHMIRTEFGLTVAGCMPYDCALVRPSATVSYIHRTILQGHRFKSHFVRYNESSYYAHGSRKGIDLVAPGIGLDIQMSYQVIFSLNYDAELSRQQITQRASCRFQRAY